MIDKVFLQVPAFRENKDYNYPLMMDKFLDENPKYAAILGQAKHDYIYEELAKLTESNSDDEATNKFTIRDSENQMREILKKSGKRLKDWSSEVADAYYKWREMHKEDIDAYGNKLYYSKITYEKYEYNDNLRPQDQSRNARNNMLIDIASGILSASSSAVKFSNPGSFDKIKRIARVSEIAENEEYRNTYMEVNNLDEDTFRDYIMKDTLENLDNFLKTYGKERDVLSPQTFIYNHKQNMTGAKLIGIYANNNSMQSKFQETGLKLKEEYTFKVNGRTIERLDQIRTQEVNGVRELISKNCAEWLAASVDNVKDPVLAKLLQNPDNANITGYLLRAGLTIDEVGLFFRNPVIKYLVENNADGSVKLGAVTSLLNTILEKYGPIINQSTELGLSTDRMFDSLINPERIAKFAESEDNLTEDQLEALPKETKDEIQRLYEFTVLLGTKIMPVVNILQDMTNNCREDSPNGAIKRTLPMALNQKIRLLNFWDKAFKEEVVNGRTVVTPVSDFPLESLGAMPSPTFIEDNGLTYASSKDELREALYKAGDGMMLQAFTTLGVVEPVNVMQKWFSPFQKVVLDKVEDIIRNSNNYLGTLSDDHIDTIFSDLTTFLLSKTSFLGNDSNSTYEEKRDWYLFEFPKRLMEIMTSKDEEYKPLQDLEIIKRLKVKKGSIQLNTGGNLTNTTRQLIRQSLDSLIYLDNPHALQLATDLFAYAYYSKGFKFDAFDYAQFFSTTFLTTVSAPIIQELRDYKLSSSDMDNFQMQLYNNRHNTKVSGSSMNLMPYIKFDPESKIAGSKSELEKLKEQLKKNGTITFDYSKVWNNHMKNSQAVFPVISTNVAGYAFFIHDGNPPVDGKVTYRRVYQFKPETEVFDEDSVSLSKVMYNANSSSEKMASAFHNNKESRKEKLLEAKKLSSYKRKKSSGKSKVSASKIKEAQEIIERGGIIADDESTISKSFDKDTQEEIKYSMAKADSETTVEDLAGMSIEDLAEGSKMLDEGIMDTEWTSSNTAEYAVSYSVLKESEEEDMDFLSPKDMIENEVEEAKEDYLPEGEYKEKC